ncbi:hypothetical protein [Bradyrhizobium sp. CCBAU 53338]|uniref:hypothetical protein n=1 Tax=Bradyrhizobium sp. CCBAU 53338 TaxID=1325111 RepID=UPI00188A5055|nr:hypothetical protein [Bradyrhizobium sp. CCBAU 53338]QOZ51558.1 hypothetical protein XH90_09315 [Bradyrhizobium sp. CCBAU 53338]
MGAILAKAELPYHVTYLPPRARTRTCRVRLSAQVQVSIATGSPDEAPVAFRINRIDGARFGGAPCEIRAFAKKLWWPILDGNHKPLSAVGFLDGLEGGKYEAIRILDPSRLWYSDPGKTIEDHFRDRVGDRIVENGFDESFAKLQGGAAAVMICDDALHFAGGTPVLFGHCTYPFVTLQAGTLSKERPSRVFGSSLQQRDDALREGYVFDLLHHDREIELMRSRGVRLDAVHQVECTGTVALGCDALHHCADEAVRRLIFSSAEISAAYRNAVSDKLSDLIPLGDCRHILGEATRRVWRDRFGWRHVELALQRASHIVARLALHDELNLAPEDEEALSSLAAR